jgi:hypothetical protein
MTSLVLPTSIFAVIKVMVLLGLALYVLFAAIMMRQEALMDKVIDETFEPILRVLVAIHLAFSIGIFFLALAIL